MLDQVAVNTHIEVLTAAGLHYDQGYVRCVRGRGTVDSWMFHVTEIRTLEIQHSSIAYRRIELQMIGGGYFHTPACKDKHVEALTIELACAFLALRDYELGLDAVTYSERCFDTVRCEDFEICK